MTLSVVRKYMPNLNFKIFIENRKIKINDKLLKFLIKW